MQRTQPHTNPPRVAQPHNHNNVPRPPRVDALSSRVSPQRGGEKLVGRFKLQPVDNNNDNKQKQDAGGGGDSSFSILTQGEEEV